MWPMISKKMEVISKTMSGKELRMEVEAYTKQFRKENDGGAENGGGRKWRTKTQMSITAMLAKKAKKDKK